jgi:hypothetical protein
MKKIEFILFAVIAALLVYLLAQNEKLKSELWSQELESRQLSQLFVRETIFKAKENHSYFIKAKLDRENGENLVIPILQKTTGISGDDDNEATLHLIEHVSEDNERYFKMRVQNGTSWSVSNFWRQLVPPEEYDLSPDEWDSILNMLFYRDVWDDSDESFSRWKLSGQEFHTVGGIIIEEIEGGHSHGDMGTSL